MTKRVETMLEQPDDLAGLRKAAHDAPLNKVFTDHKGRRHLGTHSMAWARAGREWCNASRPAMIDAALAEGE